MDPFQAGVNFILGRLKQSAAAAWMKFLFELGFSAVVSYLVTSGLALIAGKPELFARGSGQVAAAISLAALFRRESSRLTRGMLAVLPGEEAALELNANLQTIQKSESDKK